jgi:hypothetical protein
MSGSAEVIREIKKILEDGKPLDVNTRDRLLLSSILDIYQQLEQLTPVLTFYKIGVFFASALGLSILGFIGALITGAIQIVFK